MFSEGLEPLTVSELAKEINCSIPVATKKVEAGLKTKSFVKTEKVLNGKTLDAYFIPEAKLEELKEQVRKNKEKFGRKKEHAPIIESTYEVFTEPLENSQPQSNSSESELIRDLFKDYSEELRNVYKEHIKELEEKNQKIYLIEDSEKRKEKEYLQQIAELKTQIAVLTQELESIKSVHSEQETKPLVNTEIKQLKEQQNKGLFGWFKK